MNKWTLEKINDCEEIKLGAMFIHAEYEREFILRKSKGGFDFWDTIENDVNGYSGTQDWEHFKFYRPNGTEILPPEDSKIKKEIEAEFQEKSRELIKFLNNNCHPHTTIIITPVGAKMVELKTGFKCEDYLRD